MHSPLSFSLSLSSVVSRQSRVQVGVALYQSQSVSLTVASHFQSCAVFDVCLYESTDVSLLSSLSPANR